MSNPNYYEYEEYSRRRRDPSPGHYSGGGGPPSNTGRPPSGGAPYTSTSRLNEYPPQGPPSQGPPSPREFMTLEPPPSQSRPRSVPPPATSMMVHGARSGTRSSSPSSSDSDRRRSRSRRDRDRGRERSPSPVSRARNAVEDNFSNSATGIGAGLLGAVVGGLVAREASEAVNRKKHKEKGYGGGNDDDRTRMVSTILGAVAGGLASNAIANRVEDSRDRDRARQYEWERRYGREEDLPRYDAGRSDSFRSRDNRRDRALPPPDDDDDDLVYGDQRYDDRRPSRRRSEESYRSRP
ncbi:hypothetical protein EDB81DRAFT_497610 [Dactylonectria macrodidyma]|uniref:Glycine zipper 2TM domain-containing protein n=1 Tax=Dactylonectria macrodidyma TaxID=307937 RepID=A0A9P9EWD6_9HYPO|nr:hypothetical protein EDB81DRAFT_497610 [Dactylonectria macrodidyma]